MIQFGIMYLEGYKAEILVKINPSELPVRDINQKLGHKTHLRHVLC